MSWLKEVLSTDSVTLGMLGCGWRSEMVASDGPGQMIADLMCWFLFDVDSGWIETSFSSDAKELVLALG